MASLDAGGDGSLVVPVVQSNAHFTFFLSLPRITRRSPIVNLTISYRRRCVNDVPHKAVPHLAIPIVVIFVNVVRAAFCFNDFSISRNRHINAREAMI
jgi:hypothetical protein